MPDKPIRRACPYLGLVNDPASHFVEPDEAHRCYSPVSSGKIQAEYQENYCLAGRYASCKRFVPLTASAQAPNAKSTGRFGDLQSRIKGWSVAQWLGALFVAAVGLLLIYQLILRLNPSVTQTAVLETPISGVNLTPTRAATPTARPANTETPPPGNTPQPTATKLLPPPSPLEIPPAPVNGVTLVVSPDSSRTGFVASKQPAPVWNDRNLHAGEFQGQTYLGLLDFDLRTLPPGSKIEFAALELTGRNDAHLASDGRWQLELVDARLAETWNRASFDQIRDVPALAVLGEALTPAQLAAGHVNRVVLDETQRQLLENQLDSGHLTLRVRGPDGSEENLFTWEAGADNSPNPPSLFLVAAPAPYTVITNTPTPENVLTAAAYVARSTERAARFGTPTPLPLGVVTATPGGESFVVTAVPTPENVETAQFLRQYATAVAMTTGTFTPTPAVARVVFPTFTPSPTATQIFVGIENITPAATATRRPNLDAIPLPDFLKGNLILKSNRFDPLNPSYVVMRPNGQVVGMLTGEVYYRAALSREAYSPDRTQRAAVRPDSSDILQIWIEDAGGRPIRQLTGLTRGIAYDPVWSPNGKKIAFVTTESRVPELYVYDLDTSTIQQLTFSPDGVYNQHPSWSPDSRKIAFKSNRTTPQFQIWMMDADGQNAVNLSNNTAEETDPVWVK